LSLLTVLLFAIPAAVGALVYFAIYYITESFVKKVVRDPLFKNSIRAAFWTFITPVWLLLIWLVLLLTGIGALVSLGVILGLVVCGIIALQWWPNWKKVREWGRHAKYKLEGNKAYLTWLQKRNELKDWINSLQLKNKHV